MIDPSRAAVLWPSYDWPYSRVLCHSVHAELGASVYA